MSAGLVGTVAPRIQVFRPTMEQFSDFSGYISYMESRGAHKAGLAKVIPPKEWIPRKSGYDDIGHLVIPSPISQMVTGRQGLYQQYNIQKRSMTVKDFQKLADSDRYRTPDHFDYEDLERKYWKNITYNSPIYGADVSGSLYDPEVKEFNINNLNTILDCVSGDYGIKIDGVNTAYLYFGMWKTSFAWHTEDMDLYSINYLHFGAPKSWYVIPPEHGKRLERFANGFFPSSYSTCPAFLRHKMTIISPPMLKQYAIPYDKITQEPGEFMITFPYGYHAGYNHGFNCAESTNFATERWVEYGKRASQCTCRKDSVKISMDTFVKRYQPDRYELWLVGKDVGPHPEDPSRCSAAPPPSKCELVLNNNRSGKLPIEKRRRMADCVSKRLPISKLGNVKNAKKLKKSSTGELDEDEQLSCDESTSTSNASVIDNSPPAVVLRNDEIDQHIRGLKCHVLISKANDDSKEYRASLGGLVELQTVVETSVVANNRREPIITTLPETVRRLQEHIARRSKTMVPQIVVKNPDSLPKTSYKSILLPRKVEPSVKRNDVSPINNRPTTTTNYDRGCSAVNETKICGGNGSNHERYSNLTNGIMSFRELSSADAIAAAATTIDTPPLSATSSNFIDLYRSPAKFFFQSDSPTSTKFDTDADNCAVNSKNSQADDVISLEHTYAAQEINSRLAQYVCNRSDSELTSCSSPEQLNGDSEDLIFADRIVCAITSLPMMDSAAREHDYSVKPRTVTPPMLLLDNYSKVTAENEISNQTTASLAKELDIFMSILPREQVTITPMLVSQSITDTSECCDDAINDDINNTSIKTEVDLDSEDSWSPQEQLANEWARPLTKLWQHKRTNFDAEMAFNEFCAKTEPHCSICSLFAQQKFNDLEMADLDVLANQSQKSLIPSYSRVLMPEAVFLQLASKCKESPMRAATDNGQIGINDFTSTNGTWTMSNVDDNGCSRLLICEDCKVCVHASCYGVMNHDSLSSSSSSSSGMMLWRCSRCIRQNVNAECCLCVLRGGALKPTTDGRWAHVICTLVVHDVFFETVPSRELVNISRITLARLKLNCVFCQQLVRRCGRFSGACIQCSATKCSSAFHVTCGIAAGVKFEACDWPELIRVTCPKHCDEEKECVYLPELKEGQTVISKYRNNRYYHCAIQNKVTKTFYSVSFDANTTCDNLHPRDIESRDCLRDGPPAIDEQVQVRWTDNKLYDCVFRGMKTIIKYEVRFEDGSSRVMDRQYIFTLDEELPKRVKSRLSTATETKHPDAFPVDDPILLKDEAPPTRKKKSKPKGKRRSM